MAVLGGRWMFLGMGALTGALAVWSSMAGCRASDTSSGSSNVGGAGGAGTSVSSTGESVGNTTSTTTSTSVSTSTSTSSAASSGSGGDGGTGAIDATIPDITTGKVGKGVQVKLTGVVAMSQKFLVSKSNAGSCLWGFFASAPKIAETAPNSGILILSYGTQAAIPDGGNQAFCPRLGIDPIGDGIPDDIKPGDVVDAAGKTDYFLLSQCANEMNGSTVGQFQLAQVKTVTKTGTATPPAAHVMTAAEAMQLASPTDKAFHDQWGGVKVALQNVTSVPQDNGMGMMSITDQYGHIVLNGSNLQVGDKIYYRGYLKAQNFCYNGPVYASPTTMFTAVEGFNYLDYCTWGLAPNDKCADLAPPSPDAKDCNNNAKACAQ